MKTVTTVQRGKPSPLMVDDPSGDAVDGDAIIVAIDRLKKASRCVGAMALDWMIAEETAAYRSLLELCGIQDNR